MTDKCAICREQRGFGNNPYPLLSPADDHRLCDQCNSSFVIPLRVGMAREPEAAVEATRAVNQTLSKLHNYDTSSFTYPPANE